MAFRVIALALACLGLAGLVLASVLTLADVGFRFAGVSASWVGELVGLTITLSIALFFPLTVWENHNLTIGYLGDFLGGPWRRVLRLFGALATLAFFALILWYIARYALEAQERGLFTPMAAIEIFPVWFAIAGSFALVVVIQLYITLRRLADLATGRDRIETPIAGEEPGP